MKALVYNGPRQLDWQDWPAPSAGPGEVVVAVRAVGICGSDIHGYTGESARRTPPMVMGHEFTGEVVETAPGLDAWRGRLVIVRPFIHCGECAECRSGRFNLCRNRRFLGVNMTGGMAERVAVPVDNLLALDPHLSPEEGALTEPLSVGIHAATIAGNLRGARVFICGGGAIGLLALVAAREAGAREIVLVDPLPQRREAAVALGAAATLAPDEANPGAFDVAFDAVGEAATIAQAIAAVVTGGTVVGLGGWKVLPVNMPRLVAEEIVVRGSFNFTPDEFATAARWLADRRVDTRRLITSREALSEGAAVFAAVAAGRVESVRTVLRNES